MDQRDRDSHRLTVARGRFRDAAGRDVLLHGINLVEKDPRRGYIGPWDDGVFRRLAAWGFNSVRLGVIWDGIEPEPGRYDTAYVERVRQVVRTASAHHLGVVLDMHQDLYSVAFSDGAPAWATLTGGHRHIPRPLWSDAYLVDEAVQAAFDAFWANHAAPDGVGLQDHYAAAWQFLVGELHREPNVIGYDLMNEPASGSAMRAGLAALAEVLAQESSLPVGGSWLDPRGRQALLDVLADPDRFRRIADAVAPAFQAFEQRVLNPFYARVARAIRAVDPNGILFLEPQYACNAGIPTALDPVPRQDGRPDPQQAYAPHVYDLVTDTPLVHQADARRVAVLFEQHRRQADRLGLPLVVGEWGAFADAPGTFRPAWDVVQQLEQAGAGDWYWHYRPGMDRFPAFPAVARAYPAAVAGTLRAYDYDPASGRFVLAWDEDGDSAAPTVVYLPHRDLLRGVPVTRDVNGRPAAGGPGVWVDIAPKGGGYREWTIGPGSPPRV